MEVDPSETSVNITLDTSYEKYLFGIGQVSNKSLSRGIHWTCRYYKKDAGTSMFMFLSFQLHNHCITVSTLYVA